jgi:hypothetical protein
MRRPVLIAYIALAATLALLFVAAARGASTPPQVRVNCFPASSWDASLRRLPCTTVVRPDNDRVRVIQGTASRELAECVIDTASVNDARCHRTPPTRAADPSSITPTVAPAHLMVVCSPLAVCASIGRTQEDGSVNVGITVDGHAIEGCVLGNPREERGRYRQPCWRSLPTGPSHPEQP